MKNNKKFCILLLSIFALGTFSPAPSAVSAQGEGFTATKLASSQTIIVDGVKDTSWDSATAFNLDTIRQLTLNGTANNSNPATGAISVMYNSSKLYLFAEITDSTKLTNVSGWDPFNAIEYNSYKYNTDYLNIQLDIKHNGPTNYDQPWGSDYNDGKDVAAHFELAAGAGELKYSADGSQGWVYDDYNDMFTLSNYATTHSTIYSLATETGYTFEMEIDLADAGVTDFTTGKTIGLYVGYWDRFDSCGGNWGEQSLTTTAFEWPNYLPWNGPGWLPEVTFVASENENDALITQQETKASLAFDYSYTKDENGNYTHHYYDNVSIMFGADVETSLFNEAPVSAGVYMVPTSKATGTIAEMVENNTFNGSTLTVSSSLTTSIVNDKEVYSVGGRLNVIADNVELSDDVKTILKTEVTAAVYFELQDGTRVVLQDKTYSVLSMTETYLGLEGLTNDQVEAIKALNNYINL